MNNFLAYRVEFTWQSLLTFITGIIAGMVLITALMALLILLSLKRNKKLKKGNDIEDVELKSLIDASKANYLLMKKSSEKAVKSKAITSSVYGLMLDIAKRYYPKSKRPLYELTLSESLMLVQYIHDELQVLFNKKIFSFITNKMRIINVLSLIETSQKIQNNKVAKAVGEGGKTVNKLIFAINVINPLTWIKKGVNKLTSDVIVPKIIDVVIEVVGIKTNQVYSKHALRDDLFEEYDNVEVDVIENKKK
ncbi:MAG: hypothetical protein LBM99_06325 [Bacillales bacterium]|jgi:hypothetical protein|nr:hypothetical protein [Bacillales bacterium]